MRFTLRILGAEIFHVSTDPEPEDDKSRDLSGGTVSSIPISMTWRLGEEDMGQRPEWD